MVKKARVIVLKVISSKLCKYFTVYVLMMKSFLMTLTHIYNQILDDLIHCVLSNISLLLNI